MTAVDLEIETLLRDRLLTAFPTCGFHGEETGKYHPERPYIWFVDPIDGTAGYQHGVPLSAIIVTLTFLQAAVLTLVDFPAIDRLFTATAGGGAYENGEHLRVGEGFSPDNDVVCHGDPYTFDVAGVRPWLDVLGRRIRYYRSYTDAFGHCLVARGSAALVLDGAMEDWERVSFELLIREAGGVCHLRRSIANPSYTTMVGGRKSAVEWALHALRQDGLTP